MLLLIIHGFWTYHSFLQVQLQIEYLYNIYYCNILSRNYVEINLEVQYGHSRHKLIHMYLGGVTY